MAKYFTIVDKLTGEQCSVEGSGLYSVSNDVDLDNHPVHDSCIFVELDQEEAGVLQEGGFEVMRNGKKEFVTHIADLLETDNPISAQKHKIDLSKARKRVKDRTRDLLVNLHGVSYTDKQIDKVIVSRIPL